MNETLMIVMIGAVVFAGAFMLLHAAASGYSVYRRRFTDVARTRLEEAFVFVDTERLFLLTVAGGVAVPLLLWFITGDFVVPLVIGVLAVVLPRLAYAFIHRRRRHKITVQLPDVLLMISSSLRAGTSLQIALDLAIRETPVPLSQELAVVMREQRLGLALEDALDSMAKRLKMEDIDLVVSCMSIARDIGGNLAETLDRLAGTLRAKATMEGKIRSLTAQGKLQGLVVGMLPILLLFVLNVMEPAAMWPMFHKGWGWVALGAIAVLELIGFLMIRKIVNIDV